MDVLFPQTRTRDKRLIGHTVDWLRAERVRVGDEFFANQYENNPLASGTQTFTVELIARQTLFHMSDIPSGTVAPTFIVGDLSYVGDKKRDRTVFYAVRLFMAQLFVFDAIFGKWDSEEVAQNLLVWIWKYRPYIIWLERFLGWEAYDKVFTAAARSKGLQRMPIEWHKMSQQENAKKIRIGAIKGPLSQRRLWLYAGMPGYDILCKELYKWPKLGRRDDFADNLGLVCEVPSGYEQEAPRPKPLSMFKKYNQAVPPGWPEEAVDSEGYGCGSGIVCE